MVNYKLYIGANNETKEVEIEKIEDFLNPIFPGFTIENAIGYWNFTKEDMVIVSITTDKKKEEMEQLINTLKVVLKQEAIGLEILKPLQFI